MNHTPGPWAFDETKEYFNGPVVRMNGVKVAAPLRADVTDQEYHANARLIAAAPELLEALKTLTADMEAQYRDDNGDMDHDGIERANTAIAKAEGSPAVILEQCK